MVVTMGCRGDKSEGKGKKKGDVCKDHGFCENILCDFVEWDEECGKFAEYGRTEII